MDKFRDFLIEYRGAIIGAIIAIILLLFNVYRFIVGCLIIIAGIVIGNYVQRNKDNVKKKLRNLIDRW